MSKINPINLRDLDWYRNFAQSYADNSHLDTGFEVIWASKTLSKIYSYGTCNYSDLVWIAIF